MAFFVQVPLEDGQLFLIETEIGDDDDLKLASTVRGNVVARAQQTLEESLKALHQPLQVISHYLRTFSPDEACIEFGVKIGAETGLIIAKGTTDVNFVVKLMWKRDQTNGE